MDRFAGKTVWLSGAASGIGKALAEALSERGASLCLVDQSPEVEAVGNALHARFEVLDVRDSGAVSASIGGWHRHEGRLDVVFNNAGIAVIGEVADTQLSDWYKVLDVNLRGVIHGVHAAYPLMLAQGFGHIVNTASLAGLVPSPKLVPYSASKFAVVGLSLGLRSEAKHHGVSVSAACPGFIRTPIVEHAELRKVDVESLNERIPWESPESCAAQILRGVAADRGLIIVTRHARVLARAQRLAPGGVQWMNERIHSWRQRRRLADSQTSTTS